MKHFSLIFCAMMLLASCRKDNPMELTSDVYGFKTNIEITYDQMTNKSWVFVYFYYEQFQQKSLQLPANSYLKVNGTELTWMDYIYGCEFTGKSNCLIELMDHDETLYTNYLVAPDTAYIINLPDTVLYSEDFEFLVNSPIADSNEFSEIGVDSYSFDYGYSDIDYDSLITIRSWALEKDKTQLLHFYRIKTIPDPNLPVGGGTITYKYYITDTFYTK